MWWLLLLWPIIGLARLYFTYRDANMWCRFRISKLDDRAIIPEYATAKSSGFDLCALDDHTIEPGQTVLVQTGLACILPGDTELQVRPRSGKSLKTGLRIANSPGTVDQDYLEKDIGIICWNSGITPLNIKAGEKIAQGVISPVIRPVILETNPELFRILSQTKKTTRMGGFGSTENNK
jgi:dUTP pyrophosphatase